MIRTASAGIAVNGIWQKCLPRAASSLASLRSQMPPLDFEPFPYKGPPYEKLRLIRKNNIAPCIIPFYRKPLAVHQGHMQWLFDDSNKRYLDLIAGIVTVSVGHCHPHVTKALEEQIHRLWHTTNIYLHPKIHEFAEKLVSKLPGNLKVVYFVNSGSEANDMAVFLARAHTGNFNMISLRSGYHGMSPYTMGITAFSRYKYNVPSGFGIHHTMNPDVYAGLWGGSNCRDSPVQAARECSCSPGTCKASDMYISQLEEVLNYSVPQGKVAGFIAESIQGVGGTIQFPRSYLKRASEIIRKNEGVVIMDEVQSGFGRTGEHYWGFQMHGVTPDIVTMAKGIGNGFPLAAVVTTPEIAESLTKALHFNTFGGNPMACAVGIAVMEAIDQDGCQENSQEIGTYLLNELGKLRDEFTVVGDVRGKGLMIGIELVSDQESRAPLPAEQVMDIWEGLRDGGILVAKSGQRGNVLRIKPPMCITKEDAKYALSVLREVLHLYSPLKK